MITIQFQKLWDNHPLNLTPQENFPCRNKDGAPGFENQCAIKMSIALFGAGVNMGACKKVKCWYSGHKNHVIRAQELADWLSGSDAIGAPTKFKKAKTDTEATFQSAVLSAIKGKKGIVLCQNFWGTGMQGDHIDAWSGDKMAGKQVLENYDYFGRSKQVWFWNITV